MVTLEAQGSTSTSVACRTIVYECIIIYEFLLNIGKRQAFFHLLNCLPGLLLLLAPGMF